MKTRARTTRKPAKQPPDTLTINLPREWWHQILDGWVLYTTAVPYCDRPERFRDLMPAACRRIAEFLSTPGRTVDVPWEPDGWCLVAQWLASVAGPGRSLNWSEIGATISAAWSMHRSKPREDEADGR